jgi:hypothetical protein
VTIIDGANTHFGGASLEVSVPAVDGGVFISLQHCMVQEKEM